MTQYEEKLIKSKRSLVDHAEESSLNADLGSDHLDMFQLFFQSETNLKGSQVCSDLITDPKIITLHCENREERSQSEPGGLYVCCLGNHKDVLGAITQGTKSNFAPKILSHCHSAVPWFPRTLSELDKCVQVEETHPGSRDPEYIKRRCEIGKLGINYRHGDAFPTVNYTESEVNTWRTIYNMVKKNHYGFCVEYLRGLQLMETYCGYSSESIPQLETISKFLKERTGFQLKPVGGLIPARNFLASLALRTFQCTQYVRHHATPAHTPEPDCCHELLGHVPMFLDPVFADFSQEIGLASLGASDEDIKKLSTLYWYTVEFGLCREDKEIKVYGAALISSFGEFHHALSDNPEYRDLDIKSTCLQQYQDLEYQPLYYVANSFRDALKQVRYYSENCMQRAFKVSYDKQTEKIRVSTNLGSNGGI